MEDGYVPPRGVDVSTAANAANTAVSNPATNAGSGAPPKAISFRELLKLKAFRRLWLAQLVSIFGDFLAIFGVISLISFRLHGTPLQVTGIMIAYMAPLTVVGTVAGVFVDRWNIKRVMISSDLLRAVLVLLLVFVTRLDYLYAIFFGVSCVSSFFGPAQSVTLRTVVPVEGLLGANALMSQAFYSARIAAPAVAGGLVALLGEKSCFYLDSASFLFSAAMLSTLVILRPASAHPNATSTGAQPAEASVNSWTHQFTAGVRFIFTHEALSFVMISMAAAMFVLSCFSPLISVYVRDFLAAGSLLFGVVSSLVGVGLIVGTQMVHFLARSRPHSHASVAGLFGLGVAVALLGLTGRIPLTGLSTFGMGFAIAFVVVPAQTLMQRETPPAMLGRVSSAFLSLLSLAQVLGLILSGYLAQSLGIRNLFKASAVLLLVLAVFGYFRVREA